MTDDARNDVEAMHRVTRSLPLLREAEEPTDGNEPTPWWMWTIAVLTLFIGGVYLGRHFGSFSPIPHIGFRQITNVPSARPELARPATGEELYQSRCASCHQADLGGLANAYPPLVGSEYVVATPSIPVRIVLQGLSGPLQVAGATYNGQMPGWAALMTDAEIASVLTYVRGLSNASAIDEAFVAGERAAVAGQPSPMPSEQLVQMMREMQ